MLDRTLKLGLCATLLLLPLSLQLHFIDEAGAGYHASLPAVEPLLWLLFLVWLLWLRRQPAMSFALPAPFWAFAGALVLSAVMPTAYKESAPGALGRALRELLQAVDYYIIFLALLLSAFRERNGPVRIFNLLIALASMIVLVAALQWLQLRDSRFLVSSVFDHRNELDSFLAVLLPLLFGVLVFEMRPRHRTLLACLVFAGLALLSTLPALVIAGGVICALSLWLPPRRRWAYLMCLGVASTVALFSALQDGPLEEFLFEPRSLDRYTASVERSTTMMEPPASVQFGIGQRQVRIGVSVWPAVRLNRERIGLERDLRMRSRLLSEAEPHVQQRFLEWQAALNTVEQSPLVGVGPGRYQEQVGYHFYELPKLNTLEPGAQNGFLVILVTSGFLGLSAFSWILLHLVSLLRELANGGPELRDRGPAERGLDLGLGVALASFVLVNIFYDASSQHATTMLFVVVAALVTLRHAQDRPVRELVFDGEPPAHPSRTHSSAMADRVSPTEATSSLSLDQRGRNGEEGSIPTPC